MNTEQINPRLNPPAVPASLGLFGDDTATVDDKWRLMIAKKSLRMRLGDPFVLTVGPIGCLTAYPMAKWAAIYEEIFSGRQFSVARERYVRGVFQKVDDEMSFDAQGRMTIPVAFRELIGEERNVYWRGCGEWLEIWDVEEWESFVELGDIYSRAKLEQLESHYEAMMGAR